MVQMERDNPYSGTIHYAQKHVEQWKKNFSSLLLGSSSRLARILARAPIVAGAGGEYDEATPEFIRSYISLFHFNHIEIHRHITRPFVCYCSRPFISHTLRTKSPLSYLIYPKPRPTQCDVGTHITVCLVHIQSPCVADVQECTYTYTVAHTCANT